MMSHGIVECFHPILKAWYNNHTARGGWVVAADTLRQARLLMWPKCGVVVSSELSLATHVVPHKTTCVMRSLMELVVPPAPAAPVLCSPPPPQSFLLNGANKRRGHAGKQHSAFGQIVWHACLLVFNVCRHIARKGKKQNSKIKKRSKK